jgi:hypothetical protein
LSPLSGLNCIRRPWSGDQIGSELCATTSQWFTLVIYLLPNGRQSRGLHALAYRILEVLLETGAGLGLMVVRQS